MRGRSRPPRFVSPLGSASNGLALVKTMPREPTAAQKSTVGQEIPNRALNGRPWLPLGRKGIRLVAAQDPAGPVGFVETATSPLFTAAAQREGAGQEMPVIGTDGPVLTSRQPGTAAFALALERTLPLAFPARQRLPPGQSTASRSPGPPGVPISLQAGATAAGIGGGDDPALVRDGDAEREAEAVDGLQVQ